MWTIWYYYLITLPLVPLIRESMFPCARVWLIKSTSCSPSSSILSTKPLHRPVVFYWTFYSIQRLWSVISRLGASKTFFHRLPEVYIRSLGLKRARFWITFSPGYRLAVLPHSLLNRSQLQYTRPPCLIIFRLSYQTNCGGQRKAMLAYFCSQI